MFLLLVNFAAAVFAAADFALGDFAAGAFALAWYFEHMNLSLSGRS